MKLIKTLTTAVLAIYMLYPACARQNVNEKSDFPTFTGKYLGQKTPRTKPLLFAPQIVSTKEYNDRDLTISPAGDQLFFARTKTGKKDDYDYDIMYSEMQEGIWSEPKKAWFSSSYAEVEAFFTPDGKQLFFNSNRPASGKGEAEHWETWIIKKEGYSWSAPKLIGPPFERTAHTTFTQNGKMYFHREDTAALYRATYKNGIFGQPEKLDPIINSEVQYNCFVAPDESYLIFSKRSQMGGFGSGDLYISFRNSLGEWDKPLNLGPEINSPAWESCPNVSYDGKFFFFTSSKGGNNDVYWVSIEFLDQFRPK